MPGWPGSCGLGGSCRGHEPACGPPALGIPFTAEEARTARAAQCGSGAGGHCPEGLPQGVNTLDGI